MKSYVRRVLLVTILIIFSSLLFYVVQKQAQINQGTRKQILSIQAQKETQGLPVRLTIPTVNVNAAVEHVGVNSKGEMEVPSNTVDVGWFKLGSRPGEKGSVVISGHFDGKNGEAGVFNNLYKLKKGDKLYIKDDKGITTSFVVKESRIYEPGYAEGVFSSNDGAHLNLVTCDGVWDGTTKSYTKRLVVFADLSR